MFWFERFRINGEFRNGTYIPLSCQNILVRDISHKTIEDAIDDLLKTNGFKKHSYLINSPQET